MNDNLFHIVVSALIAVAAIVASTAEVQARHAVAAPAHATTLLAQEIVTLPEVTVIGHRSTLTAARPQEIVLPSIY